MDRKNLLTIGGLMGIIVVIIGIFVIGPTLMDISDFAANSSEDLNFNNSTPEALAISIARLNEGSDFEYVAVINASLTSDGKYWIVNLSYGGDYSWVVTVDAKTGISKKNEGRWKSLDELKAIYIADIQSYTRNGDLGEPSKITMGGKEVWKVQTSHDEYVYVDLTTGKSKNTGKWFNKAAGTDGWLTLKEVDNIMRKIGTGSGRNALRNLYPE